MAQITYRIEGNHGSIKDLEFENVPPFCVITGENGAGKTHLLEVLANAHGAPPDLSAIHSRGGRGPVGLSTAPTYRVLMTQEGRPYATSRALFASTTWVPHVNSTATVESIVADAHQLYKTPNTEHSGNPLFRDWEKIESSEAVDGLPPGWDTFLSRLTPKDLLKQRQDLAYYFLSYQILKTACIEAAKKTHQDQSVAIAHLGPPPWELFNAFCKDADIGFEVVAPSIPQKVSIFSPNPPQYKLAIRDTARGITVDIDQASTGERIMVAIVSWRFWAAVTNTSYEVIILDEPDAHLHPSLVRKFLSVLQTVLVEQYGARVIITTHSPSTVSFSPEGSVFELRRHDNPRIIPVINTGEAVAKLCGGLITVDPATRFVVLEGPTDMPFYRDLWTLMTEAGLPAFPGISFFFRDGCTKVQETIHYLRKWEFNRFFGILDRDAGANTNTESEGVFVLDRNGVENYLFDPLNIWLCLWMHRNSAHSELHQIPSLRQGNGAQLKSLAPAQLQLIVDSVWRKIRARLPEIEPWMDETTLVGFHGGVELRYPRWFLDFDDHSMASTIRSVFGGYQFPPRDLRQSFMTLNLIPQDLWKIFYQITRP